MNLAANDGGETSVAPTGSAPNSRPYCLQRTGPDLVDRLQLLAGLEANRLARRNRYLGAGARVAPYAGLARPHVKHSKASQFNAVALGQRSSHAFENGFHGQFGLGFGNAGLVHHFIDDVELDHWMCSRRRTRESTKCLMLRDIREIVNGSFSPVDSQSSVRSSVFRTVALARARAGIFLTTGERRLKTIPQGAAC